MEEWMGEESVTQEEIGKGVQRECGGECGGGAGGVSEARGRVGEAHGGLWGGEEHCTGEDEGDRRRSVGGRRAPRGAG